MKIAVAGTGYVGLSIATLLAQHNEVTAVDVIADKVDKINNRVSPIQDEYIEKYLAEKDLDLRATLDARTAYRDADFVVIAAPTNYDPVRNYFDTHCIEDVIDLVLEVNPDAVMVIKSTIPVGYCRSLYLRYARKGVDKFNLLFSPEFLRESTAALQAEGLQVYGFIPGDALLRGPLYKGLPTLEAHRTAAPSAAFADLALNYGLDGIFAGDPEVSTREQEYIRHFCTTGELCLPVALRPGYETLYDRTFTCRPDSPKTLVRYQESRLYSCFGSTVQPDNCVERRRRCVTMDNIGYGRYSGEIQLMRADLPADEKVNVIGEVPAEYDLLLDCIKRGKTFRMVKTS